MKTLIVLILGLILTSAIAAGELANDIKMPDNSSGFMIDKKISTETLQCFYEFAIEQMRESNFGMSRDMFECITKSSNSFPMSNYYLALMYTNVDSMRDAEKAKKNWLTFVSNKDSIKKSPTFVQQAYQNLIDTEHDKVKLINFAKTSLKINKNIISLTSTLKAYQKVYANTNDEKYADMADAYSQELSQIYKKMDVGATGIKLTSTQR